VHGGAVTIFSPLLAGSALLLLLVPPGPCVHGGTITVVTLLLLGSTSWLPWLVWLCELCCDEPPVPGVTRMVPGGGGVLVPPDDDELDELLDELELDCVAELTHGCIATASVRDPLGMTIWLDPGGILVLPGCADCASEQEGMTIVRSLRCLGISTVRTPGVWSAADTGSELDELDELELLLPHAASASESTATTHIASVIRSALVPTVFMRFPLCSWPVLRAGSSRLLLPTR
jgi:hypothetical protein